MIGRVRGWLEALYDMPDPADEVIPSAREVSTDRCQNALASYVCVLELGHERSHESEEGVVWTR